MAGRRSRRRKPVRRSRTDQLPGWVWMLFGLAVGLSVAAAIYVNDRTLMRSPDDAAIRAGDGRPAEPATGDPASPATAGTKAPADVPRTGAGDTAADEFDFYEMLPRFEVIIPEQDLAAQPDRSTEPLERPGTYVLQAGSFSRFPDADRVKAELGLLGIASRIQKVSIDERTYFRVRIGPVERLDELNALRRRLHDADVDVMVIRVGG